MAKISSLGRAYCDFGRERLAAQKTGARVTFPDRAGWKYLPAGIYYHLISSIVDRLIDTDCFSPGFAPALAASGINPERPEMLNYQYLQVQMTNRVPLSKSDTAPGHLTGEAKRMVRLIRELTRRDNGTFTREQFFNYCSMGSFTVDHHALFNHLLSENMVRLVEDQSAERFEIVDQVEWISSKTTQMKVNGSVMSLRRALQGVYTLHEVVNLAAQTLDILWGNSRVYLYDKESGKATLAISSGDGDKADSHYQGEWIDLRKINAEAERRYVQNGRTLSVVDLKAEKALHGAGRGEEAITDLASIEADHQFYVLPEDNPGKLVYGVFPYTSDQAEHRFEGDPVMKRKHSLWAIWTASNRLPDSERARALAERYPALMTAEPISANNRIQDVASKLHSMVLREVAQRISEICGGRLITEVWQAEERSIAKEEDTGSRKIKMTQVGFSVVSLVVNGSQRTGYDLAPQLTMEEKMEVLEKGEIRDIQGQRVRIFEYPYPKLRDHLRGFLSWMRETVLAVYEKTKIAEGKTKEEMIASLSLEDEPMMERTVNPRYTVLIEGLPGNEHDILGIVSFNLIEVNIGKKRVVAMKIPAAMIREVARGKKLQVAITNEIGRRLLYKYWYENGIFRGFWLALTRGIPVYATSQSLRVIKDFSRMSNFSLIKTINGKELTEEQKLIIEQGSQGKADDSGIETNAYGGRIAIDEEEAGVVVFGKKQDAQLREMLKTKVGENGRIHMVAYYTLWVGLKTMIELALGRLKRKMFGWSLKR
ncbi:hypothetical protein A3K48_04715 [candidate division WOR-1 bacterium RIFOXYA12_FULL_52_29]|uniref:Uncharacterized protein n=1 Tax=candidate division WOR-1 bacterium RIFOXYC12_FULL_54_18 TaxID=1802584 RepID=A0A1F4T6C4_UNCSA|nr:MAG: hypothetical protein A3K44_04715 [candidate division WOR-1 bacterium RIFOXYA2_FULL_51_19]OGC17851.1 MAG: hypothetical protein A3K48_04715 [candidate division WOR-1 bacterium RIFOXYA12_FULL_52_29]OGC26708.1 MAG: hypothetical protein A3K32_04710 [candidate division WOR-1 bacterium RIFOXYB2_FULL_45_9]OGC28268.1 MAG: hypothetical protein A3K49_04715 [candidate division WOR-1 bacterium RIFOXYC12_FULL_54_18]OGC31274.1 MAG: hypothetical protein A2346_07905 [candidate division WOR-1 bacterium R